MLGDGGDVGYFDFVSVMGEVVGLRRQRVVYVPFFVSLHSHYKYIVRASALGIMI